MRKLSFCFCLAALCNFTALAQSRGQVSKNFLKGKHIFHTHPDPRAFKAKGNIPAPHGFPAGVDTITNFTGHFQAKGIYPISRTAGMNPNIWEYSMVGNPPAQGGTTVINAPTCGIRTARRLSLLRRRRIARPARRLNWGKASGSFRDPIRSFRCS